MPFPPCQLVTLPSGLRLVTVEMPHMESASVGYWAPMGSRHEPSRINGIAHFIEHLVFKGTQRRTSEQISREIERLGATIDAFTSEDHTCFHAKGPAERTGVMLEVIADMVGDPLFADPDISNEREVIRDEISMVRDQPSQWLDDLLSAAAWGDHPLGRPITGTESSLDAIRREDLVAFHQQAYAPELGIVAVAGNVRHEAVRDLVAHAWAGLPPRTAGSSREGLLPVMPPFPAPAAGPKPSFGFSEDDCGQAHVGIGFRMPGRLDPGRHAVKVLNVLLGENMSSRLFQALREQEGLCYQIQSDLMAFEEAGMLQVFFATDPKHLPRVLKRLGEVLTGLREEGPTEVEVVEALGSLVGQTRIALETTGAQMSWAAETLLGYGECIPPARALTELATVSLAETREAAARILVPEGMSLAAVGPPRARKPLEDWLADFSA